MCIIVSLVANHFIFVRKGNYEHTIHLVIHAVMHVKLILININIYAIKQSNIPVLEMTVGY